MPTSQQTDEAATIHIGAVSYLNSRPLTLGLADLAPDAQVILDLPSRLADGLQAGRLDVALVPSIEYARHGGYMIVSDACVACDGPVRSVKLYSRVPVERIETLALDEGSRTSVALARILLKERFGLEPELKPLAIGSSFEAAGADAAVLIGDRGIRPVNGRFSVVWDLGEEWSRWTGLPFVFAMWIARSGADLHGVDRSLATARDQGVQQLAEIARREAPVVEISETECLEYLRDNLRFRLGNREIEGLKRFYELAQRHHLVPAGVELAFYDQPTSR